MGCTEGINDGSKDGSTDGCSDGCDDGDGDGCDDGDGDGCDDGNGDGCDDGDGDGYDDGDGDGYDDGDGDGIEVGGEVGIRLGNHVGVRDGKFDGELVSANEGIPVGCTGFAVGISVGTAVLLLKVCMRFRLIGVQSIAASEAATVNLLFDKDIDSTSTKMRVGARLQAICNAFHMFERSDLRLQLSLIPYGHF